METLLQGALALFAALGLVTLAWLAFGHLLLPREVMDGGLYAVLPARGDAETLEQDLRRLLWLRDSGTPRIPIVIADGGLSPQGRRIAQALLSRYSGTVLCPLDQLSEYLASGWTPPSVSPEVHSPNPVEPI